MKCLLPEESNIYNWIRTLSVSGGGLCLSGSFWVQEWLFTSSWSSLVLISPELGLFVDYLSVSHPLSLWSTMSGLTDSGYLVSEKLLKEKSHQSRNCIWNGPNLSLVGNRTLHQKNIDDLHFNFIYHHFRGSKDFCAKQRDFKKNTYFVTLPPTPAYSSTEINRRKY